MQLNIITGPMGSGKTTKLRELLDTHADQNPGAIINASSCTTSGLIKLVQRRIQAGATCIFIDDCSPCQIGWLRKLTLPGEPASQAKNLSIHAVAQA